MMIHFLQVLLHSDKLLVGSGLKYADDNKFFFSTIHGYSGLIYDLCIL